MTKGKGTTTGKAVETKKSKSKTTTSSAMTGEAVVKTTAEKIASNTTIIPPSLFDQICLNLKGDVVEDAKNFLKETKKDYKALITQKENKKRNLNEELKFKVDELNDLYEANITIMKEGLANLDPKKIKTFVLRKSYSREWGELFVKNEAAAAAVLDDITKAEELCAKEIKELDRQIENFQSIIDVI